MINAHIYCVTNNLNFKEYVGQTTVNRNKVGHGKAITEAYFKYGKENFSYDKICSSINSRNLLNYLEKFWIKTFDSIAPNGYNIELGGTDKGEVSEQTKQKLRKANLGKVVSDSTKQKISNSLKGDKNPFYGKTHTIDNIEKIKEANSHSKKPHTTKSKQKMSEKASGENNPFYGKKHSEEAKLKMSLNSRWKNVK